MLSITIWLVPARKENIAVNVPPYLNAETTVLQDINDTGYFQVCCDKRGPPWSLVQYPDNSHPCIMIAQSGDYAFFI